eukprot:1194779-Prorocentrum_minimum.AAC.3
MPPRDPAGAWGGSFVLLSSHLEPALLTHVVCSTHAIRSENSRTSVSTSFLPCRFCPEDDMVESLSTWMSYFETSYGASGADYLLYSQQYISTRGGVGKEVALARMMRTSLA